MTEEEGLTVDKLRKAKLLFDTTVPDEDKTSISWLDAVDITILLNELKELEEGKPLIYLQIGKRRIVLWR